MSVIVQLCDRSTEHGQCRTWKHHFGTLSAHLSVSCQCNGLNVEAVAAGRVGYTVDDDAVTDRQTCRRPGSQVSCSFQRQHHHGHEACDADLDVDDVTNICSPAHLPPPDTAPFTQINNHRGHLTSYGYGFEL